MLATSFVDTAKVMSKVQVTIPKDIRQVLGLNCGDRITFLSDGKGSVRIMNSAVYAMQVFQGEMDRAAAEAGLENEDDVMALISDLHSEGAQG